MAQVPNYYYNSPWIADAARNLSSALAPPDPSVLIQRESQQLQLDEARKAASRRDLEVLDKDRRESIAKQMAEFKGVIGPDGQIDHKASKEELMTLYGAFLDAGGDVQTADYMAGPYAPGFGVKMAIEGAKEKARLGYLGVQQAGAKSIAELREAAATDRTKLLAANRLSIQELKNDAMFQAETMRAKVRLKIANDKLAAGGGGKPMKINDSDLQMIQFMVYKLEQEYEEATGKTLHPTDRHRITDESIKLYQNNGNPEGSTLSVWDSAIGLTPRPEPQRSFWDFGAPDPIVNPYVVPTYEKLGTVDYGSVLAPDVPAQAPAPAAAPPPAPARRPPRVPKDPTKRKPIEGFGR